MPNRLPTQPAADLLSRRGFLGHTGSGLGAIALTQLLHSQGLLAASPHKTPLRPAIEPVRPHAPRAPHFAPRAKNVLMIFCSGALSHMDTFDYKPELFKRHGQPMPGAAGLVTFQGENGNLTAPPWKFRPRGQCGKMTSDLLPRLGELVDDLCFVHSLTSKTTPTAPAKTSWPRALRSTAFPACAPG